MTAFSTTRILADRKVGSPDPTETPIESQPVVEHPSLKDYWDTALIMLVDFPAAKEAFPSRPEEPEYDYVYTKALRDRRMKELKELRARYPTDFITRAEVDFGDVMKLILDSTKDLKNTVARKKRAIRTTRLSIKRILRKKRRARYIPRDADVVSAQMLLNIPLLLLAIHFSEPSSHESRNMRLEEELKGFSASKAQSGESILPVDAEL